MKKILFIHHATGWGGAPKSLIQTILALDKKKFQIEVFLFAKSVVSEKLKDNDIPFRIASSKFYEKHYRYFTHSEAEYTKWYNFPKLIKSSVLWLLSKYYFAPKELKQLNCDIIHLNSSVLTDWLKPASNVGKVIMHVREPFRKGKLDLLHYFFRNEIKKYSDKIIAISKDNAKRVNLNFKTEVVYNFSDLPKTKPKLDSYNSKKFLYVGGSSKIKGFITLVNSLDLLNTNIKIYFAGHYATNEQNSLKTKFKKIIGYNKDFDNALMKFRLHPNAIELGMIDNIEDYLSEVCCLISPFTKPHFSRPIMESHLHFKPVIGSDIKGMEEIINHNVNGYIFEKNNYVELARTINYCASDSLNLIRLGNNGFKVAEEKFTNKNVQDIQNIYIEI